MPANNGAKLRHFADVDDLFDSGDATNEQILEWVNEWHAAQPIVREYARLKEADEKRRDYHKRHQEKQKLLLRAANELLQPDEKERLALRAAEIVAERQLVKGDTE